MRRSIRYKRAILNKYRKQTTSVPVNMVAIPDALEAMEEYVEKVIPVDDLIFLRSSIHSADTTGEELVIKDLRIQMDRILKKLGIDIKNKFELVSPFYGDKF